MQSNFDFLKNDFPILYQVGSIAEKYLYTDSNSCLIKLGMFGETTVNLMMQLDKISPPKTNNTHASRMKLLKNKDLLPNQINSILHALRLNRNQAVHGNLDDGEKCKTLLQMAYNLAVWFIQVYGGMNIKVPDFVMPIEDTTDYDSIIKEQEKLIVELTGKIKEIQTQNISKQERIKKVNNAVNFMNLSEKETRYLIDEQLCQVGWEADTQNLRYSNGTRPQKGRNIAIAEWPTEKGHADYALFVGMKMVGIIEAKKTNQDIPSVIDVQGKEYAKNIINENYLDRVAETEEEYCVDAKKDDYQISNWNGYKVPFIFATNGRKYLEQIKTKSGVWFLDLRDNSNIPKALQGWVSPDGIMEWLEKDIQSANDILKNTGYDLLTDKDGLNLRRYQIKAIEATEKRIMKGAKTVLLSMATGTGKTRTILGMIYRFLKSNRFNRILFLVDRTSLGTQALDVFNEVKLEDLLTLNDIYNINNLEEKEIERETKIQVATVQSLVHRIMYNEGETIPAVSDYDLIIVDEAHRGYTLDKEMDEDELLYRNQDDFVSKYRTVIEYFDAVKIALTATPALHTTEIFGKPVFNYSYREAVIDGYLVDHDAPHDLKTKLSEEGIKFEKGEVVAIYDPITGEITNSDELEDELKFDIEQFNRKVITADFNKTVLKEIANHIDPEGEGKTLIYAVDDNHADLIVSLLREIYEPQGVDQDAIMKITGSIGDKKRVGEAIRRYKNERFPSIAVTVDLLTTGIDVPEITTIIFMRRVKSRILFEQMLGRATRLCQKIDKTHFEIYDPVGVYESLQEINTMKPVVVSSNTDFDDLIEGLNLQTEVQIQNQIDMIVAKMRRKIKKLSKQQKEYFEVLMDGKTPIEFIEEVKNLSTNEAKEMILNHRQVFELLSQSKITTEKAVMISDKEDELISHTRGYGKGQKPQDYLEEFKKFITENIEKIETLKMICTRPSSLTRQGLKNLRIILDQNGFTEKQLNSAWKEWKNEDIAADIISLIRAQAIGSELINHDERIKNAIKKLKTKHSFSKMEEGWLDKIEKNLLAETILTEDVFNSGIFRDKGGFVKIDKIFKNKLKDYIVELNEYLYEDGGKIA